jgi:hypothetical protein
METEIQNSKQKTRTKSETQGTARSASTTHCPAQKNYQTTQKEEVHHAQQTQKTAPLKETAPQKSQGCQEEKTQTAQPPEEQRKQIQNAAKKETQIQS